MAWGIGYYGTLAQYQKRNLQLDGFRPLFWGVFITAWIGAKLFFLINSSGGHVHSYVENSNFWLGGGFVFYGGLITGLAFIFTYCLVLKKFPINNLYLSLPSFTFAHALGRVGCLLAGCCYGTQCELPWAINLHNQLRHPVQLYESFSLLLLGMVLKTMIGGKHTAWKVVNTYLVGYAIIRFILEYFRGDKIRGTGLFDLSASQTVSIALLVVLIILNVYKKYQTDRPL